MGADGTLRGRVAASIDASGAALGSLGLALFALVVWRALPKHKCLWSDLLGCIELGRVVVWSMGAS